MTRRQFSRNLLLLAFLLAGAFVVPFVRDEVSYQLFSASIEQAQSQLRIGMSEAEVRSIMGEPDEMNANEDGRYWSWEAREHQGDSFKKAGLASDKGHYGIWVKFDDTKRAVQIQGGVN
jgi:outer membrane protein assembly factor BamE (lipoprotein component of BamABCDE complex)